MDPSDADANLDESADIFANSSAETVEEVCVKDLSSTEVRDLDLLAQRLASNGSSAPPPLLSLSPSPSPQDMPPAPRACPPPPGEEDGDAASPPGPALHSSDTSFVLSQFVRETCVSPQRIYCPFCVADFGFEFLLKAHIKDSHLSLLHRILKGQMEEMEYHVCPFCPAKFYIRELLPRHLLSRHDLAALSSLQPASAPASPSLRPDSAPASPSLRPDSAPASPALHLRCHFCPYKVLKRHYRLLVVHVERRHGREFEALVHSRHSRLTSSCRELGFLSSEFRVTDQVVSPGLSEGLGALRTHDDRVIYSRKPLIIKPILKVGSDSEAAVAAAALLACPSAASEDKASALSLGRSACRRLRFDLPDSPVEGPAPPRQHSVQHRMVQAFAKKEKRFKWKLSLRLRRKKKKDTLDRLDSVSLLSTPLKVTPVKSAFPSSCDDPLSLLDTLRYKCGICGERFGANGGLVEHVRRRHKGIKLRSMYHCGECSAKFFRNSFLVQHCSLQHSPLCLAPGSRRSVAY